MRERERRERERRERRERDEREGGREEERGEERKGEEIEREERGGGGGEEREEKEVIERAPDKRIGVLTVTHGYLFYTMHANYNEMRNLNIIVALIAGGTARYKTPPRVGEKNFWGFC